MPEYIECPLSECTHARLPNGDVVECYGSFKPIPEHTGLVQCTGLCARIVRGGTYSDVYWPVWPVFGITPVKERPKPEPVTVDAIVRGPDRGALQVNHVLITAPGFSAGDRVRVTVEKIEEGE